MMRKHGPNILVTGTPGVGKTTLCKRILEGTSLRYLNIAEIVKEKELHSGWDDEMQCSIYDEDRLATELARIGLEDGGFVVDFHSVDGIAEEDIDHVIVLSTEIEELAQRLKVRGYAENKIDANIEAEIFKVCLQDALDIFGRERVVELPHNNEQDADYAEEYARSLLDGSACQ